MNSNELFQNLGIDKDELKREHTYRDVRGSLLNQLFPYLKNLPDQNLDPKKDITIVVLDDKTLNEEDLISSFQNDEIVRVEFWKTLTQDERDQVISKRVEVKIVAHLSGDKAGVEELFRMIEKFYPEYMYAGSGFRAVSLKNDRQFNLDEVKPYSSWSISPEGRQVFVENDLELVLENSGFTIHKIRIIDLEADIIGISLIRLIKEKFNHLEKDMMIRRFFKEDEVIAREIVGINKIKPRIEE